MTATSPTTTTVRKHPLAETDFAWLAGLIDGEGCIYATYAKDGYLRIKLMVAMTHRPTIEHCAIFGGTVLAVTPNKSHPHYKQSYRWQVGTKQGLLELLRSIRPYMVTKALHVDTVVELLEMRERLGPASRTRGVWRETDFERQEELYNRIREHNRRGA